MSGEKPKDVLNEIDVRLNGVLSELGRALGEAMTKLEEGGGEVRRAQSFRTAKGPFRAEAGIKVRMGGLDFATSDSDQDSEHTYSEPVNTPAPQAPPRRAEVRDIAATIVTHETQWTLTAELPGVTRDGLEISVSEGQLTLAARGAGRVYAGAFQCPGFVQVDLLSVSLHNGILDITAAQPGAET